jgi:hypothetical protein
VNEDNGTREEILEWVRTKFYSGYDDVGKIITAHIKAEQAINVLIDRHLKNPAALYPVKLEYHQSVHLALAFGMPAEFKKPLIALGEMRNKFAHEADYKIDRNKVDNFYKTLSPSIKEHCQKAYLEYREFLKTKEDLPKSLGDLEPKHRLEFILMQFTGYLNVYIGMMAYQKD